MTTAATPADLAPAAASREAAVTSPAPLVVWLGGLYLFLLGILVVGGITRLTGSGLSIVDWEPLVGAIPPLSERAWLEVFARYQTSPQYQQVNAGMSLDAFKWIFFWEYFHRLLARLIGVATLIPWLVFVWQGRLRRPMATRTFMLLVLGGLQGVMGWCMVASGLVDVPAVSHYRLAAHLFLALLVGAWMAWLVADLLPEGEHAVRAENRPLVRAAWALVGITLVTAIYGAFMAGSRAGYLYATFPTHNGEWWPTGALALEPLWKNPFENALAIHAIHRWLGWLTAAAVIAFSWRVLRQPRTLRQRQIAYTLLGITVLQFTLGMLTVLFNVAVPIAVAHQAVGFILVTAAVFAVRCFPTTAPPRVLQNRKA